jgi:hypothetical protein
METYERKICKLPGCNNLSPTWRKQFCCASHAGKYGALHRSHKVKIPKVNATPKPKISKPKLRKTNKNTIVGPMLPRRVRKMLEKGIVPDKRKFMYRVHLVKLATPRWADLAKINEIYEQKMLLNNGSNLYHVDHIIPLNHPLVCGLHVETNLRIISKNDNEKKNNKFIIE